MKNDILDEYSMRQASIYELRNLAREVGVISPTTLKKEDLINKMLRILSGEEKPEMPKSKQGRPPKQLIKAEKEFLNKKEVEEDIFDEFKYPLKDYGDKEIGVLSSNRNYEDEVIYDAFAYSLEEKTGYFHVMEDGFSFIFEQGRVSNVNSAILVSKNIADKFKLSDGDLVKCECKNIATNNTRFLTEVLEINGCKNFTKPKKLVDFNKFFVPKEKELVFDKGNNKIYKGTRNIFVGQTKDDVINFVNQVDEDIKLKNAYVLRLGLEILPEDVCRFNNSNNKECFYTEIGDSTKQNVFTIELFLQRIKCLAEQGINVIAFVEDLVKVVKFKNFLEGYSIKDIKGKSLDLLNQILISSRNFENNSITVLCGIKNNIKDDFYNFLMEQLEDINCNFLQ